MAPMGWASGAVGCHGSGPAESVGFGVPPWRPRGQVPLWKRCGADEQSLSNPSTPRCLGHFSIHGTTWFGTQLGLPRIGVYSIHITITQLSNFLGNIKDFYFGILVYTQLLGLGKGSNSRRAGCAGRPDHTERATAGDERSTWSAASGREGSGSGRGQLGARSPEPQGENQHFPPFFNRFKVRGSHYKGVNTQWTVNPSHENQLFLRWKSAILGR